jgi:hypothetical protein
MVDGHEFTVWLDSFSVSARAKKWIVIGVVFGLPLFLFAVWWVFEPKPIFVSAQKMRPITSYEKLSYGWNWSNPYLFQEGKVWVKTEGGTNTARWFLCDLVQRTVLGELLRGDPMFVKGDNLVCVQRPEPFGKLIFTLEWIANNRIPIGPKQNNFWKVNMKNGSAMKLGECLTTARSPV